MVCFCFLVDQTRKVRSSKPAAGICSRCGGGASVADMKTATRFCHVPFYWKSWRAIVCTFCGSVLKSYRKSREDGEMGTNEENLQNQEEQHKERLETQGWTLEKWPTWRGHISASSSSRPTASSPFGTGNFFAGGGLVPAYPHTYDNTGCWFHPTFGGIWGNGVMHCQQQKGSVFPNGFPIDSIRWPPQNYQRHPFQRPDVMLFRQPVGPPGHTAFPDALPSPGQPNFFRKPIRWWKRPTPFPVKAYSAL